MLARCLLTADEREEIRIFYSYSREDTDFRSVIDDVLGRFKWDVEVRTWYDGEIPAGAEWEEDIFRNIDAADIIVLFVTRQFADSAYCRDVEVPRALQRREFDGAIVIPVLVEKTSAKWLASPLAELQVLPRNGVPVSEWADQAAAVRNVVQGIVDIIAAIALDPDGRCRWQLHLDGSPERFSDEKQLELVHAVRKVSNDQSTRPLVLSPGSIVLLMDSSRAGLSQFRAWYQEQEAPLIAGYPILRVIELFGAGVQAAAHEVDTPKVPDSIAPDLLLFPSEPFVPVSMKGVTISEDKPLRPDFILDTGHTDLNESDFAAAAYRLIDYFITSMSLEEDEQWVNLSPDETNRMLGNGLAGTAMGAELLHLDLNLKRLTASLMHPDSETGRAFWKEVFRRSRSLERRIENEFSTFQRVWLVPKKAKIYEHSDDASGGDKKTSALIVEDQVSVMCEDDYISKYAGNGARVAASANDVCSPVFREMILPVVEKEVNEGKTFANWRQIYQSVILATWTKENYRGHSAWAPYIESGKPGNLQGSIRKVGKADLAREFGLEQSVDSGCGADTAGGVDAAADAVDARADRSDLYHNQERLVEQAVEMRRSGAHEKSRNMLRGIVNDSLEQLGIESHITQAAMLELGNTYRALGSPEAAQEVQAEVLRIRRHVLGDDHPATLEAMDILADTFRALGEDGNAAELQAEKQERRARTSEAFSIRENREFFERYMRIFRNGVFRLEREDYVHDLQVGRRVCRSYFAGAIDMRHIALKIERG